MRSSASGEDSAFSFAGQYDTILHVPSGEVAAAVVRVFAGFFNPSALMLRLKRGFGALELGMGALVMPMVEGRVSGVAYSTDPSSQDRETVRVEAVQGLGLKLGGRNRHAHASYLVDRRISIDRGTRRSGKGRVDEAAGPLIPGYPSCRSPRRGRRKGSGDGHGHRMDTRRRGEPVAHSQARPMALRPAPACPPAKPVPPSRAGWFS